MTERTFSIPPPIAQSQVVSHSPAADNPRSAPTATDSVDEEPYTIKCICDYADDDGNTILCEKCDTWQHIECFYPGHVEEASRDDFSHFCADCDQRPLDRGKAHDRQRQQRQDKPFRDDDEKKPKKPPTKSHKKKPKPSDILTNGIHDDSHHGKKGGSPHDHTSHAKKSKSHHRSQPSISSQPSKRSSSHHSRNHSHVHPLSPVTTPPDLPEDFIIHTYSKQFQCLCDNDPGAQDLQANSFASLSVTDAMSLWLRDPEKLREDAGVQNAREVFQMVRPEVDFAGYRWPKLQVESKPIVSKGSEFHLRYLSVIDALRQKDALVGELKGFVGFQKDYVNEEHEAYAKLCHPAPFVFFHPSLPLYIDTRREGSQCRYIRRSCRANTTLDTYITNQSEYHFCFLTEQSLSANDQITMPWDFRFPKPFSSRYLHLLGLSDDDSPADPDMTEQEYDELSDLISSILSDYGGCACGLGNDCAFVRFHRNFRSRFQPQTHAAKPKKTRKPKQHVSPISTGHATNSRDASEGRQEVYDAEDDSRSTSGSVKPHSRDMTPFANGLETSGRELVSDRDKRKLADIEKSFEQLDKQPPKKKKRGSDGLIPPAQAHSSSGHAAPPRTKQKSVPRTTASTSMHQNGSAQPHKDRGSLSRQHSESPTTGVSPKTTVAPSSNPVSRHTSVPAFSRQLSPVGKNKYVETATQTDPEPDAWYNHTPGPKRKFVRLSRRLVENQRKVRAMQESRRALLLSQIEMASRMEGIEETNSHPSSPESRNSAKSEGSQLANGIKGTEPPSTGDAKTHVEPAGDSVDVSMPDAPAISPEAMAKPLPPSWPGVLHPVSTNRGPSPDQRTSDLKIQLPTVPSLSSNVLASPSIIPGSYSLYSPAGSIMQSPLGTNYPSTFSPLVLSSVGHHPPIKKKLSLSAYNAMRKKLPDASATSKTEPNETEHGNSPTHVLKTLSSLSGEVKASDVTEKPAASGSPLDMRNKESVTTGVTVSVNGATAGDKQSGGGTAL